METFFSHKDAYAVLGLLVAALGVAVPFIAHYWYKTRRAEMELSLKQAMVERGMTAAEIVAVMEAGKGGKPDGDGEPGAVSDRRVRAGA
jgi:hypothetical protein